MARFKIKCVPTDAVEKPNIYADYVAKSKTGWSVCAKAVEKPYIFTDYTEADMVRFKLSSAFKGKLYFLIEVTA